MPPTASPLDELPHLLVLPEAPLPTRGKRTGCEDLNHQTNTRECLEPRHPANLTYPPHNNLADHGQAL